MTKTLYRIIEGAETSQIDLPEQSSESDTLIIGEAQLILAEKRTCLAAMRTGLAVIALPLSIVGLLIATSQYYHVLHVLPLIIPLGLILLALIVLGGYLIIRALRHIQRYDRMISRLKAGHAKLSEFID